MLPASLIIGTFDGVHRGHANLAAKAARDAHTHGASAAALVFDPHPATLLRPQSTPPRLMTFEQKASALRNLGIEHIWQLQPTRELLDQSADLFARDLLTKLAPAPLIIAGPDFRFGKSRQGSLATFQSLGARVLEVPPVSVALNDHTLAPARSSMVRWLLAHGRVTDAAAILGRWHTLQGLVEQGDQRGRHIGFPTANFTPLQMLPADGVYASRATLQTGEQFAGALSIGRKPTFIKPGALATSIAEVHLIDWPAERASQHTYGWPITLELVAFIREQMRFENLDALKAQLASDVRRIRALMLTLAAPRLAQA